MNGAEITSVKLRQNLVNRVAVGDLSKTVEAIKATPSIAKFKSRTFGLHPVFCRVFLLCDIAGCTILETAAILGIGPAAVALRLARARREINIRQRSPNVPAVTSA